MFLHNMFNDPYIIRTKSSLLRRFIATMITLTRAEKSQDIYRQIGGKSPLLNIRKLWSNNCQTQWRRTLLVDFVMRYTPPMANEVCQRLKEQGVEKVYLIPLYPQYSSTTTQSSLDDFETTAHKIGWESLRLRLNTFLLIQPTIDA
jgi:protoporphyrin/coproporphyrin ferrochelatase